MPAGAPAAHSITRYSVQPRSSPASGVVQCFGREVEPADEPDLEAYVVLYRAAANYHQRAFARGEHNVAVAFNAGGPFTIDHSHTGRHSEDNLNRQPAVAGNRAAVTRIHTEREPCGNCENIITNDFITPGHFTENEVTYWGEYQDKVKKKKGTVTVKDIAQSGIEKMFVSGIGGSKSSFGRERKTTSPYVS